MLETEGYSMHSKFYELIKDLLGRRLASSDRQGTPMGFQGRLLKLGPAPNFCFLYVTGQNLLRLVEALPSPLDKI